MKGDQSVRLTPMQELQNNHVEWLLSEMGGANPSVKAIMYCVTTEAFANKLDTVASHNKVRVQMNVDKCQASTDSSRVHELHGAKELQTLKRFPHAEVIVIDGIVYRENNSLPFLSDSYNH